MAMPDSGHASDDALHSDVAGPWRERLLRGASLRPSL